VTARRSTERPDWTSAASALFVEIGVELALWLSFFGANSDRSNDSVRSESAYAASRRSTIASSSINVADMGALSTPAVGGVDSDGGQRRPCLQWQTEEDRESPREVDAA
jgi:hypothetical protein